MSEVDSKYTYQVHFRMKNPYCRCFKNLESALIDIFYKANAGHADIKLSILVDGKVNRVHVFCHNLSDWGKYFMYDSYNNSTLNDKQIVAESQKLSDMYAKIVKGKSGNTDMGQKDWTPINTEQAIGRQNRNQTNNNEEYFMDRILTVSATDTPLNVKSRDVANTKIAELNDIMSISESKTVKNIGYELELTLKEYHNEFDKDGNEIPYEREKVSLKLDLSQDAVKNITSEGYMLLQGFINEATKAIKKAENASAKKF